MDTKTQTNIPITKFSEKLLFEIVCSYDGENDKYAINALNDIFLHSVLMQYYEVFNKLLHDSRIDISMNNNLCFIKACILGNNYFVNSLLKHPKVDPADQDNKAIRQACKYGKYAVVKLLLEDDRIDPGVVENYCINIACLNYYTEIVKLLIKDSRVNPSDCNNRAIKWASSIGCTEIVQILLQDSRVDCTDEQNMALENAMTNGHFEVVKLLLPKTDLSKIEDVKILEFAKENGFVKKEITNHNNAVRGIYTCCGQQKQVTGIYQLDYKGRINSSTIETVTPLPEIVIAKSKAISVLEKLIANPKYTNGFFSEMFMNIVTRNDHSEDSIESIEFLYANDKIILKNRDSINLRRILKWAIVGNHLEIIKNVVLEQKSNRDELWTAFVYERLKEAIRNTNEELAKILIDNITHIGCDIIKLAFEYELPNIVKLLSTKIDMSLIYDIRIHIMADL